MIFSSKLSNISSTEWNLVASQQMAMHYFLMLAQISGDNIIRKKDWKVFENFESCFLPLRDKNRTFLTPFLNNCWGQNSLSLQLSLSVSPQLSQALMQC